MKKFVIFAMNLLLVIALLGCGTKSSESESDFKYEMYHEGSSFLMAAENGAATALS